MSLISSLLAKKGLYDLLGQGLWNAGGSISTEHEGTWDKRDCVVGEGKRYEFALVVTETGSERGCSQSVWKVGRGLNLAL